jgi:hypothetical protein
MDRAIDLVRATLSGVILSGSLFFKAGRVEAAGMVAKMRGMLAIWDIISSACGKGNPVHREPCLGTAPVEVFMVILLCKDLTIAMGVGGAGVIPALGERIDLSSSLRPFSLLFFYDVYASALSEDSHVSVIMGFSGHGGHLVIPSSPIWQAQP